MRTKSKMIGIVVAMKTEAMPFLRNGIESEEDFAGKKFFKLKDTDAVLTVSGVGKVNAAYATSLLIARYDIETIINCGVSGGISGGKDLPATEILDIVVATACVQHDVDTSALGDPKGMVSTVNVTEFPVDKVLSEKIIGTHIKRGVAASGEQFIASKGKKKQISKSFNAIACDMESGAVAQCAYIAKKKFVCVRCISDSGDGKAPKDYGMFASTAAEKMYRVIVPLLR